MKQGVKPFGTSRLVNVTPRRTPIAHRERSAASATKKRQLNLWLPLTALFIVLAPFGVLLCLLGSPLLARRGINPIVFAAAIGAILLSIGGTRLQIASAKANVNIRVF